MVYTQGLKIYSAVDKKAQKIAEDVIYNSKVLDGDKKLELGYLMMDFDGRILATIGSRAKKTANSLFDRANFAKRQPGSSIKPIGVYAPAIELGLYDYNSTLQDSPIENFFGPGKPGPRNSYGGYKGTVSLQWAIEHSSNAAAVQALKRLTNRKSYDFLKDKLCIKSLTDADLASMPALALGGLHVGVTVREMVAAFQIFGNGGMNRKAEELGMTHSHFSCPNGLTDEGNYSSARDMATLSRYAMGNKTFAKIVGTKKVTTEDGYSFTNHHKLLRRDERCIGIKTGFTNAAGRTLVSAFRDPEDGHRIIVVTLNDWDDYEDHLTLCDWAFKTFPETTLTEQDVPVATLDNAGTKMQLVTEEQVNCPLSKKEAKRVTSYLRLQSNRGAPIEEGAPAADLHPHCDAPVIIIPPIRRETIPQKHQPAGNPRLPQQTGEGISVPRIVSAAADDGHGSYPLHGFKESLTCPKHKFSPRYAPGDGGGIARTHIFN